MKLASQMMRLYKVNILIVVNQSLNKAGAAASLWTKAEIHSSRIQF